VAILRVAVLMASYNRRRRTIASLASLFQQKGLKEIQLDVYLLDDASNDGTEEAVRLEFPQVLILRGDGKKFWNRGMRVAFDAAMRAGYDHYVLFNDDTMLDEDALARLLSCFRAQKEAGNTAIVAASFRSPVTGKRTYGGQRMVARGLRIGLEAVEPDPQQAVVCDSMNGNFALIPAEIVEVLGILDEAYHHHMGDVDYGLRATRAGFKVIMAPGYFGTCQENSSQGTWRDHTIPLARRWKYLMSPKGLPPKEWLVFITRHYGWRWPLYIISPYLKTVAPRFPHAGSKMN
jgi:GT2 family glycosyltransferase